MNIEEKLSRPQQYAIISILIKIMEADGVIDPNEVQFIDGVLEDFHISENEMENIDSYDVRQSISILEGLDDNTKSTIKQMFVDMAKCDGYADPRELEIIDTIGI